MNDLYIVFGKEQQIVCDACCDKAGYTFHHRRKLTHSDVLNAAATALMMYGSVRLGLECPYCGEMKNLEDLDDGA